MKSYVLSLSGGETIELHAASDLAAIAQVERRYPDWVAADQWDADGTNDDGEPCKRLLFWASAEDAEGDDGAAAVAQLETVGTA